MKISKTFLAKISRINEIAKNSNSQRIYAFQQRVESLNFAAIIFRLDIIFVTAKLVQFLKNSSSNHVMIANRVIAYLNDIRNLIIEYFENFTEIFFSASNAAFANDELIKRARTIIFSSFMMIRLIDEQSSKSR